MDLQQVRVCVIRICLVDDTPQQVQAGRDMVGAFLIASFSPKNLEHVKTSKLLEVHDESVGVFVVSWRWFEETQEKKE